MDALTEKARIAKVVYVLRKLSKKTQSKLAQTIEKTFQQIQKYETGRNSLSSPLLFAMAKSNGWDYNLLFNGVPTEMVQLLPLSEQKAAIKKFLDIDYNIAEERKLQRAYAPLMPKLNRELAGENTFKG
jgi:transcriptional regulator with XRE-family HTH domain